MTTRNKNVVFFVPSGQPCDSCWQPAVDVFRTPTGWLLRFELAGGGSKQAARGGRGLSRRSER